MKTDYTLYLVTDRGLMNTPTLEETVEQAILGGCTLIQLREKDCSSLEFYRQAQEIKQITEKYQVPLIINDRVDIALAVDAEGVHIGQSDLPAVAVRRIIGESRLLGVSVSSPEEAGKAMEEGADYLGVGAMFATGTKRDAKTVSLEEFRSIRRVTNLPVVAIGGINRENAGLFRRLGADGLAVVSAIIGQPDIRRAAAEVKKAFETEVQDEI